jgi:hypothetical protein
VIDVADGEAALAARPSAISSRETGILLDVTIAQLDGLKCAAVEVRSGDQRLTPVVLVTV